MDPVKRLTILREIEHWRNSKLLPEQYCDFLKNLYIDEEMDYKGKVLKYSRTNKKRLWKELIMAILLISLFLVSSLYFTSFHPGMQIGISTFSVGAIYVIGIARRWNHPTFSYIYLGIASLLLLFVGVYILRLNEWLSAPAIIFTITFSGAVWILVGIFARVALLHFCGWAYMVIAYTMLIHWLHPEPEWFLLQLYAIPAFVCLFLLGRSRLGADRMNGWLLIVIATMFLFIPEVYGLYIKHSPVILLIGAIGKPIGLIVIVWLVLRKPKTKVWITE